MKQVIVCLLALVASNSGAQIHIPSSGVINTIAGNGVTGFAGDGSQATSAEFKTPERIAVDGSGNVFISDTGNNRIRKINAATGGITTVAGTGTAGFSGDGMAATSAQLSDPYGIAVDAQGNVYFADLLNNRVRMINTNGVISTVAGSSTAGFGGDGGAATSASAKLNQPTGIALDSAGNLYICDHGNNRIRKVTAATGIITTIAGNGTAGYSGENVPATSAEISFSVALAVDAIGNVYLSDRGAERIRKITASTGMIATVAGNGTAGFTGDGQAATNAELNIPTGLCIDQAGDIFFTDATNNRIRKVTAATGVITTVVGTGSPAFLGDGAAATSGAVNSPQDVAIDANGNLYVMDFGNLRVRIVGAVKIPSTVLLSISNSSQGFGSPPPTVTATVPSGPGTVTFSTSYGWSSGALTVSSGSASATINTAGTHVGNYSVSASYSGNNAYTAGTGNGSLSITQASSAVGWNPPAPITYGTALSGVQLNAFSGVSGTFAYSPGLGTVLGAGTQTLTVTFTPTDTVDYSASSASVPLTVLKANPTITWPIPAAITAGTALSATQLNATASVPGSFVYSPASGTIPALGTDPLSVSFTPTDATNYTSVNASNAITVLSGATFSLTPISGPPGTLVTITNTGFGATQGTNTVTFNGTPLPVTWTASTITLTVPTTYAAGLYNVAINVNNASVAQQIFLVLPQINALSIPSGPATMGVQITGLGFGTAQGLNTITVGGTTAPIVPGTWGVASVSTPGAQTITFQVPAGTSQTSLNVVVNVAYGTGQFASSNPVAFTVTNPLGCDPPP